MKADRIFYNTLFFDENVIAMIAINEAASWIDELHITEANMTFKGTQKDYCFDETLASRSIVRYHPMDAGKAFVRNDFFGKVLLARNRLSRNEYVRTTLTTPPWHNDAVQRNAASSFIKPNDDDIVVVSDIDEILDPRRVQEMIQETRKRGIVTCKLRLTLFYFNLFSKNWAGAPDYSYRLFMMTGKRFNTLGMPIDELRKRGERGWLLNDVHCIDDFLGFHHSWLGDAASARKKLLAYAHEVEHKGHDSEEYIAKCIREKKSIFPGHELYCDDTIRLLPSVEARRQTLKNYFISQT